MDQLYRYLGDRHTAPEYKDQLCQAVRRPSGKCIRGKNGSMLVTFATGTAVVIGRQLRKINLSPIQNQFMQQYQLSIRHDVGGAVTLTIRAAGTDMHVGTVDLPEKDHENLVQSCALVDLARKFDLSASSNKGRHNLIIHNAGSVAAVVGTTEAEYKALRKIGIPKAE